MLAARAMAAATRGGEVMGLSTPLNWSEHKPCDTWSLPFCRFWNGVDTQDLQDLATRSLLINAGRHHTFCSQRQL